MHLDAVRAKLVERLSEDRIPGALTVLKAFLLRFVHGRSHNRSKGANSEPRQQGPLSVWAGYFDSTFRDSQQHLGGEYLGAPSNFERGLRGDWPALPPSRDVQGGARTFSHDTGVSRA